MAKSVSAFLKKRDERKLARAKQDRNPIRTKADADKEQEKRNKKKKKAGMESPKRSRLRAPGMLTLETR